MKGLFIVLSVIIACCWVTARQVSAQSFPQFRVTGKYEDWCLSLLVPTKTSKEEFETLIYEFRKARKEGTLSKMIPPTTPRGKVGQYGVVEIYFFSDPEWSSSEKLNKTMQVNARIPSDMDFLKKFIDHVRAYYFWHFSGDEIGSIGYKETGVMGLRYQSRNYQELFFNQGKK